MRDNMDIYDGNTGNVYSGTRVETTRKEQRSERVIVEGGMFAAKTYGLMSGGLIVSFVVAILTSMFFPAALFSFEFYMTVIVGELVVAMVFSFAFRKLSPFAAGALFFTYSILTGFTLAVFMLSFGFKTFYLAFGITGSMFLALTIVGFVTKKDVSRLGPTISVMLIALLLASVLAFIIGGVFEMLVCAAGVLVFGLVTVYDTKKVRMFASLAMAENDSNKYAVYSAMQLYLDYINILLYMIRLLGIVDNRRN